MKLAEFFVGLGFDLQGAKELEFLDKKLGELTSDAAKLLAGFGSVTTGMGIMLNQALHVADTFRLFTATTGLSARELQQWQFAAASAGIGGDELVGVIKSLQQGRIDVMMGEGSIKGWQLLGIAPSENPFDTLKALKERIRGMDPALAANLLGKAGVSEGVFGLLRLSNKEFDALNQKYQMSLKQQAGLNAVSKSWRELVFQFQAAGNSIIADLVGPLQPLLRALQKVVGVLASFGQWLGRNSVGAKIMRVVLILLAAAVVGITVALTVLLGVIGLLTVASAALSASLSPLWPILWAVSAVVLIVVGAIVALVLVVQDLWVALHGGQSVFYDVFVEPIKRAGAAIDELISKFMKLHGWYDKINKMAGGAYMLFTGRDNPNQDEEAAKSDAMHKKFNEWKNGVGAAVIGLKGAANSGGISFDPAGRMSDAAMAPSSSTTRSSSVKQENNIEVNVTSEPGNAHATGNTVRTHLEKALSNAVYQLPVPSY